MKIAILQVADTGPLESLVVMLRSVGYQCFLPSDTLKARLRGIGCDTVLDVDGLVSSMGYDRPMSLPEAPINSMDTADLYVDVKAHRNGPLVTKKWPNLRGKVLWYRINGGKPEHVIRTDGEDCGDEVNPPCPVLTPNMWYAEPGPWGDKAYACWPPFYRFDEFGPRKVAKGPPICLIHNVAGWGYQALIPAMQKLGIKLYGRGSPDGLISHAEALAKLSSALCMVHLKSSDAPGYALYEAMAARCPIVCTRRLIWRNKMEKLLIPGKTCLVFDRETHDGLSPEDVAECTREIVAALDWLKDPKENARIGNAGRAQLKKLMWDETVDSYMLQSFMERLFP